MNKSILASKTFWANIIILLIAVFPPVQTFLLTIPGGEVAAGYSIPILAGLNLILRLLTSKGITLKGG